MNKIDKSLLNMVYGLNSEPKCVECLVFANNYDYARQYLQSNNYRTIEYPFIHAIGITCNVKNLASIANLRQVKYISSVAKVFAQMDIAKKIVNADKVREYDGKNVTIAVIDTGVFEHVDFCSFKNRIVAFKDFVDGKKVPYDDNGHGTFVCGVLAGNGFASGKKFCGMAPKANIVMCKALDKNGETGALTILQAMQWIYDNADRYNIKIVCMSLGSQPLESGDPLMLGAEALWNNGLVVVSAAGNSGPAWSTIKSPGVSGKIITVGALDDGRSSGEISPSNFSVANFSSRGPVQNFYKPDCIASGVDVICTAPNAELYTKMSGTSVSTPIVAGACALLLQKYPNLSPFEVKRRVVNSCKPLSHNRNVEGFGIIDLKKMLE